MLNLDVDLGKDLVSGEIPHFDNETALKKHMQFLQLLFSPQNAPNSEGCAWYMRTALSTSWQRDFGSPLWSQDLRVNMFIPFRR